MSCDDNSTRPASRMSRAARLQAGVRPRDGVVMGKRSTFPRVPQDAYSTPAEAVAPLLPHLAPNSRFFEPCAGEGRLIGASRSALATFAVGRMRPSHRREDVKRYVSTSRSGVIFITNPPWRRAVAAHRSSSISPIKRRRGC